MTFSAQLTAICNVLSPNTAWNTGAPFMAENYEKKNLIFVEIVSKVSRLKMISTNDHIYISTILLGSYPENFMKICALLREIWLF